MTVSQAALNYGRQPASNRVIAITSGKGGVGKTNFAANLAIALARYRKKVLLVEGDLSLANVDVLLGLQPAYNLHNVLFSNKRIQDIVITHPSGVRIVPASSGIEEMANLPKKQLERLFNGMRELEQDTDITLIDTAAGMADNVQHFITAAPEVIVIITPEPPALTDAYAVIKFITQHSLNPNIHVVINMAREEGDAISAARAISVATRAFLKIELNHLGYIPMDGTVGIATRRQEPFILAFPQSPASTHLLAIARLLINLPGESSGLEEYFRKIAEAQNNKS